jgi:hypothetical protein
MKRKKIIRIALVLHFSFVIITISQVYKIINVQPLEDVLNIYSSFSYANRDFGFFAPTVNDDMFLTMQAYQGEKDTIGYRFETPYTNDENKIRYLTMLWHFGEGLHHTRMDLYARSWAVYCMNKDTSVSKVLITVNQNHIPTMDEYRKGERISHDMYYQTSFYAK